MNYAYAVEVFGGRELGQRQPRISVARETVADEERLACAVHGRCAITISAYMHTSRQLTYVGPG